MNSPANMLVRTALAGFTLLLAHAGFGQAQITLPCAADDRACISQVMLDHDSRKLATWQAALAAPLAERIGPAPPAVIEYLHLDNIRNGFPERPRAATLDTAFIEDVKAALAALPESVTQLVAPRLAGLYFVDELGGTGYTEVVRAADGNPAAAFVVFDAAVLAQQTANAWATWKENTPFAAGADASLAARIEEEGNDTRSNAIQYILLHELAHVIAVTSGIHAPWDEADASKAATDYPFVALSWQSGSEPGRLQSRFDAAFPQRTEVVYYFGARLTAADMLPAYRNLANTNFVSLYAATNPYDDFAESFASYVHVALMGRPWQIALERAGVAILTMDACWGQPRCKDKQAFIEQLLQAPPAPASASGTSEQDYAALIEQLLDEGGPSSRALIEPMTSLSQLYLEQRDFDRAADTLARARGIMRASDGFDTLPEAALMTQQQRVEEARGNLAAAWDFEQNIIAVLRQHRGALATVPYYRELAGKRTALLELYRAGDYSPQIELGCYYDRNALIRRLFIDATLRGNDVNCNAGSRDTVEAALLADIRQYQLLALDALFRNGEYASDAMQELLANVLRNNDQLRRALPRYVIYDGDRFIDALMTGLLAYEPRDAAERVRRAQFLVTAADMNVLRAQRSRSFSDFDAVLDQYRQAHAMLQREGVAQPVLDEIFAPAVPVPLPAYAPSALRSTALHADEAYVEVTFNLSARGLSDDVEVTAMSDGVSRGARRELLQQLSRRGFRPRMVDGVYPDSAVVEVRYYVDTEQAAVEVVNAAP